MTEQKRKRVSPATLSGFMIIWLVSVLISLMSFISITFAQSPADFSNVCVGDINSDGGPEFLAGSGNFVYCMDASEKVLWKRDFGYKVNVDLVGEFNLKPCVAVSGVREAEVRLCLLDAAGNVVWESVRKIDVSYQGALDGSGKISKIADIDGDGKSEIVALSHAGYAQRPRGVIVYDDKGNERWRYLIGPGPSDVVLWRDKSGKCDIVFGSYSPGNGAMEEQSGTDDMNCYVVSVDAFGKKNWIETGGHFTGSTPYLADLNSDGEEELYVYKGTAYDYRPDEGALYSIARNGKIVCEYKHPVSFTSIAGGAGALFAADKDGLIYKFSNGLAMQSKLDINTDDMPMVVNLTGVGDYRASGEIDLLVISYNRFQQGRNPRTDSGPKNIVKFSNLSSSLIPVSFDKPAKTAVIQAGCDELGGFKAIEFNGGKMKAFYIIHNGIKTGNIK
jgi:hypothetical protein